MNAVSDPRLAIRAELERIEEDCTYSSKAQFNASDRWEGYHYWIGIPSVGMSALAGTAFLKSYADVASGLSAAVAILVTLMTFLKPFERASLYKKCGDQFLALRSEARTFREVKLTDACDVKTASGRLDEFIKRRNELNQASLQPSRKDFERARQGIEEGEATHQVDARRGV